MLLKVLWCGFKDNFGGRMSELRMVRNRKTGAFLFFKKGSIVEKFVNYVFID